MATRTPCRSAKPYYYRSCPQVHALLETVPHPQAGALVWLPWAIQAVATLREIAHEHRHYGDPIDHADAADDHADELEQHLPQLAADAARESEKDGAQ